MIRKAQNSGQTVGMVSFGGLDNLLGRRLARIVDVFLEQEREAEIGGVGLEPSRFRRIGIASRASRICISAS
jgi:hypothetical protein